MLMQWLWLAAGLVVLTAGAEILVRGASRLALLAGISPLVVGLTVVAFGTSAPELAVSLGAAAQGQSDIALGNVVGSNIANVLLILGLSALVTPLVVHQNLVRIDVPILIYASALLWLFARDGRLSAAEGAFLALLLVAYTVFLIRHSRRETAAQAALTEDIGPTPTPGWQAWLLNPLLVLAGLALLVLGADWLVDSAVHIARAFGISELVIGLTIVAVGTSLPELATSVVAALRGERDIAVGNIIGSCLFNILTVLGLTAALAGGLSVSAQVLARELPIMLAVMLSCLPIFLTGFVIQRWQGALWLLGYAIYTVSLLLNAQQHALAGRFDLWAGQVFIPAAGLLVLLALLRTRPQAASH